jgi:hypothetical protein
LFSHGARWRPSVHATTTPPHITSAQPLSTRWTSIIRLQSLPAIRPSNHPSNRLTRQLRCSALFNGVPCATTRPSLWAIQIEHQSIVIRLSAIVTLHLSITIIVLWTKTR